MGAHSGLAPATCSAAPCVPPAAHATTRRHLQELAAGPPSPFTLTEAKGDTLLKLEREHAGERVTVELMVNEQVGAGCLGPS